MPDSEPRAKILVADDDRLVGQLIAEALQCEGHAPEVVQDAGAALAFLLKHRCSLLITDVEMPGTSGVQLAYEVRARGLLLPILLLSTPSGEKYSLVTQDSDLEMDVLNLGHATALPKPFDLAELRRAVRHLLSLPKSKETDTPTPGRFRVP